jgi:hypothetical protein
MGDINQAKEVCDSFEDSKLSKRLWLKIIQFSVKNGNSVESVIDLSKQGHLSFHEILPFIPDFNVIGEIKGAVCQSLQEYNDKLVELKIDLDESAKSASNIRDDLKDLKKQYFVVTNTQKCELCEKTLMWRQFYTFSCNHGFHADCLELQVYQFNLAVL